MSIMNYNAGKGEWTNWVVEERNFHADYLGKCEAIFCQGNGYLGQRAALEESYVGETRDLLVSGTFNRADDGEVTELPNLPDLTGIKLNIDGERFSMVSGKSLHYSRRLNLKTGELCRQIEWEAENGKRFLLEFYRTVSLADAHTIAFRVEVTALTDQAKISVDSGINGRMSNTGAQHFKEGKKRIYDGDILEMCSETNESGVWCCLFAAHRLLVNDAPIEAQLLPFIDRRYISNRVNLTLRQGEKMVFEKICSVYTSRDKQYQNAEPDLAQIQKDGLSAVKFAAKLGYAQIAQQSAEAWRAFWDAHDVEVDSVDGYDQLAIRFALYHLNIMTNKEDNRIGVAAKGLSGEGYKGHSFWDTEIFILPYYILTQPETARVLLEYRYLNLFGARKKAKENGFKGAMYPWESAWVDDGEVTPLWGAADVVTGKPMKILTGILEQHISADIAFGVWQYYIATRDEDFLLRYGYEIILDTAIFWASRVTWDENKQAFVICDVIGPDEYKEHVDNNAYTNYMVEYNLQLAMQAADRLKSNAPAEYERLEKKLGFAAQMDKIREVAQKLYLPKPDDSGIVEQFEGYMQLKHIDLDRYKNSDVVGTIFDDYNIEQISALQVSKQSDFVVLLFLRDDLFAPDIKEKNYRFYEERTLHDSSLSRSTHAVIASDLGDLDTAYRFFRGNCDTDLGPAMTTSDMGIHAASMGGIWQCAVYAFGGVRIVGEHLQVAPRLPKEWIRLSFRLVWRGNPIQVEATKDSVEIRNSGSSKVELMVYGKPQEIKPESQISVQNAG